jgi:hypothetical protein
MARRGRTRLGAIAQLGERLDRTQEVGGSSPPSSIGRRAWKRGVLRLESWGPTLHHRGRQGGLCPFVPIARRQYNDGQPYRAGAFTVDRGRMRLIFARLPGISHTNAPWLRDGLPTGSSAQCPGGARTAARRRSPAGPRSAWALACERNREQASAGSGAALALLLARASGTLGLARSSPDPASFRGCNRL